MNDSEIKIPLQPYADATCLSGLDRDSIPAYFEKPEPGRSAYAIAVEQGYDGTIEQWSESIVMQQGGDIELEGDMRMSNDCGIVGKDTEGNEVNVVKVNACDQVEVGTVSHLLHICSVERPVVSVEENGVLVERKIAYLSDIPALSQEREVVPTTVLSGDTGARELIMTERIDTGRISVPFTVEIPSGFIAESMTLVNDNIPSAGVLVADGSPTNEVLAFRGNIGAGQAAYCRFTGGVMPVSGSQLLTLTISGEVPASGSVKATVKLRCVRIG